MERICTEICRIVQLAVEKEEKETIDDEAEEEEAKHYLPVKWEDIYKQLVEG